MKQISFLLFTLYFLSCNLSGSKSNPENDYDTNAGQLFDSNHPDLNPMYGRMKKTAEELAIDKKFVAAELKLRGDTISAAIDLADNGWDHFYNKIIDTAMFRFNQCWLIDSTYPESYFGFAAIREYQGLNEQAEKYYLLAYKYDKLDTISRQCLHKIASIIEQQRDTIGLIKAFKRIYYKFPDDSIATGKLGFYYDEINKPDSALKYYNLTIAIDPYYFQTYINRGLHYFQDKKIDNAISDFTSAIERNKNSAAAYVNRANAFMYKKEFAKAVPDLEQCVSLIPEEPLFNKLLADCYYRLDENDKACEQLGIAIKKGGPYDDMLKEYNCE